MDRAQFDAHQSKHGFALAPLSGPGTKGDERVNFEKKSAIGIRDEMNKTEREYSFILEARKRRGEIIEWRFQGMTLRWRDPASGELMRYTADFTVWREVTINVSGDSFPVLELHEIKGGWIKGKLERAIERFRHARTVHNHIHFEMHQKKGGSWQRIH